jgi:hypothetical protein
MAAAVGSCHLAPVLAMQKVEGSSPFIRSIATPANAGVLFVGMATKMVIASV